MVFDGPGKMDFVIDWSGFEARTQGDYKVAVQLGVQPPQEFPLSFKVASK